MMSMKICNEHQVCFPDDRTCPVCSANYERDQARKVAREAQEKLGATQDKLAGVTILGDNHWQEIERLQKTLEDIVAERDALLERPDEVGERLPVLTQLKRAESKLAVTEAYATWAEAKCERLELEAESAPLVLPPAAEVATFLGELMDEARKRCTGGANSRTVSYMWYGLVENLATAIENFERRRMECQKN